MSDAREISSADLASGGTLDMNKELGAPQQDTSSADPNADPSGFTTEISDVINDPAVRQAISEYLVGEIKDVRDGNDRKGLEARWQNYRRIRRARVESETRTSPWKNSANLMPPLTAQKVNTIYAKEIAAFSSKKPPVQVTAINPADADAACSLEKFFKGLAENPDGLNLSKNQQIIFYEQVSMGVHFVKVPFLTDKWAFKRIGSAGEEQVTYVRHKGPAIVSIRLEDFFTRPYWKDIQRAPWVAIRYRYYQHELLQQVAIGMFNKDAVDAILSDNITTYDENMMASLTDAKVSVGSLTKNETNKEYEIYECYVFWDIDGDGIPEDVKFWIEATSGQILRTEYNPLSIRDIEPVIYFGDPDVLYGVGVCEMTASLQDEVTTLHNMRFDGTQLAMLKMWFARRGTGIANEKFSPMKVIELDDPLADIRAVDFPDIAPSCLTGEMVARDYADKVTGASDYMSGFNDSTVKSGATAAGTMYLGQQSNTILNSILQNAEISMTNIFKMVFYQCVANKDNVDLSFLAQSDRDNVASILEMNVEDIPTKFRFAVKSTELNKTDEARKQNYLASSQLYAQYAKSAFELQATMRGTPVQTPQGVQMQPADPAAVALAQKLYVGSTEFMHKMFEYFDVGNPDDYLPYIEDMKLALRQQDLAKQAQVDQAKGAMNNANGIVGDSGQGGGAVSSGAGVPDASSGMGYGTATGSPTDATVPSTSGAGTAGF